MKFFCGVNGFISPKAVFNCSSHPFIEKGGVERGAKNMRLSTRFVSRFSAATWHRKKSELDFDEFCCFTCSRNHPDEAHELRGKNPIREADTTLSFHASLNFNQRIIYMMKKNFKEKRQTIRFLLRVFFSVRSSTEVKKLSLRRNRKSS